MSRRFVQSLPIVLCGWLLSLSILRAQEPWPCKPADETAKSEQKRAAQAQAKADMSCAAVDPIDQIKDEGLNRSQLMATLSTLTDVIGPRLSGSPNLKRANEWTCQTLTRWGLTGAHLEAWGPFGKGWTLNRFSAQVTEPQCIPLIAYPKAWSPSTEGTLAARVIYFDAKNEADFASYKGKVKGAIVLTGPPHEVSPRFEPLAARKTDKELLDLADAAEPAPSHVDRTGGAPENHASSAGSAAGVSTSVAGRGDRVRGGNHDGRSKGDADRVGTDEATISVGRALGQPPSRRRRLSPEIHAQKEFAGKKLKFLADEEAALLVDCSSQGDGGTLVVSAAGVPGASDLPMHPHGGKRISPWDKNAPKIPPQMVLAKEHYNRLVRMIRQHVPLKMEVEISAQFHDDDPMCYNTVAEIPGSDLKDEVVMLGGHLDSWHAGTGATDNAAGVAAAMEAVRIIKALNLKRRGAIRIALWSGEEQGLRGSRAYVAQHFGKSYGAVAAILGGEPEPSGEKCEAASSQPAAPEPQAEFAKFSGYFNLDNGTGKIRGIYLQGNEAARPIFRKWLQPFREMGASTISSSNTNDTDHQSFDSIGLPGFQFIQDKIHYDTRTHHSNQDVYDNVLADDLKQAAVILASFAYNTAMRDEKLPRKPEPHDPR